MIKKSDSIGLTLATIAIFGQPPRYRYFILGVCLLLGACTSINNGIIRLTDKILGGEDNTEPPHVLLDIEPEIKIDILWEEDVGVGYGGQYVNLVPAVSDVRVVAADRNGLIQAREAKTGDLIWEVETELLISGGPGLGTATVFVGTSDAEVVALSLNDGSTLWTANVSSEVLSVPKAEQGIVIITTVDGTIVALDEDTGKQQWSYQRTIPALTLRGTSAPAIYDGLVIKGYASGKIVALNLTTGKHEWDSVIGVPHGRSELERLVDIDADPIATDGVVYVASYQGGVSTVSSYGGELLWQKEDISIHAGMVLDWRYIYLTDEKSDIWQLEQRNGSALWKQTDLHRRQLTAPAVHKDYIVVGDFDGYVHWLSQDDGHQLGRIRVCCAPIAAAPVVVDDILYVYSKEGTLAAMTVE